MQKNRIKYLQSALRKGKFYKAGSGFITMDEETKNNYTNELRKYENGGNLSNTNNLSNSEQSYADYLDELRKFNKSNLNDVTLNLENTNKNLDSSFVNNIPQAGMSGFSTGSSIGSTIGSVIPGVGTAIGGAIGGVLGGVVGLGEGLNKNTRNKELINKQKKIEKFKFDKNKKATLENNKKLQSDAYDKLKEVYPTEGLGNVNYFGANGGSIEGDPPVKKYTQNEIDNLRIEEINKGFNTGNLALQNYYSNKKIDEKGLGIAGYKGTLKSQGRYNSTPDFAKTNAEMKYKTARSVNLDAFDNLPNADLLKNFVNKEDLPVKGYRKYIDDNNRDMAVPQFGFNTTEPKKYHKDVEQGTRQTSLYKQGTSKKTLRSGKTIWRGRKKPKVIGTQDENYYYYKDNLGREKEVNKNRYEDEIRKKKLYDINLSKFNTKRQDYITNYKNIADTKELDRINNLPLQAFGGKLKGGELNVVEGGQTKSLASDMEKIEGRTHEQGGVKLANQNGKQVAEVEGEEVIKDGNDVYSKRLGYADEAEKISKKKAKYEKKLNSTNKFERATAERMVERLEKELEDLFEQQESQKEQAGGQSKMEKGGEIDKENEDEIEDKDLSQVRKLIEKLEDKVGEGNEDKNEKELKYGGMLYAGGGGLNAALNVAGQVGQLAIPLLDNLYNKKQIDKIPEIPLPEFQKARELKTSYNINPQLQEIDSTIKAYNTGVERTSIQPQVTRANSLMANIKGMREKNLLRGQKENIETRLSNQSQINKQGIDAQNIAKGENYRMNKYLRTNEILGKQSANVANAVGDVQSGIRQMNQRALDNRRITLDAAKYSDTGVSGQLLNDKNYVTSLRLNKSNQNQMKETIISSGRKDYIEQWNKLFPNNTISDKIKTKDIKSKGANYAKSEDFKYANPNNANDFSSSLLT